MGSLRLVFPLVLIAAGALGQLAPAELRLTVSQSQFPIHAGSSAFRQAILTNDGPGQAPNVSVAFKTSASIQVFSSPPGFTCTTAPARCTAATLAPGDRVAINFDATPLPVNGTASVVLVASSDAPDLFPGNNIARTSIEVKTNPDLQIVLGALPNRFEPQQAFQISISLSNAGYDAAHDVVIRSILTNGARFVSADTFPDTMSCVVDAATAICRTAQLNSKRSVSLALHGVAPERATGGRVVVESVASSAEPDFDTFDNSGKREGRLYRHWIVSNAEDEGFGSLRQALRDVNQFCSDDVCRVLFEMPIADHYVIRPQTPLPAVTADNVIIDAPPAGTDIELRGDL